jgi:hypothetical protein
MGFDSANGYFGISRQVVKGTGVAPSFFARFRTVDFNPENETQEFREGGSDRTGANIKKVGMVFNGTLEANLRADLAGRLFTMALGSDVVSGVGPYLHTITPAALMWWTLERMILGALTPAEIVDRIIDCKLNTLSMTGNAGDMVQASAEFMGLNVDSSVAAASPSYSTEDLLKFLHGTFNVLGGASDEVTSFTLTINNNIEAIQTNKLTYQQLVELNLDVSLDLTIKATSVAEYRKAYYGGAAGTAPNEALEESQVVLTFNNGLVGANEREVQVTIPLLAYTAIPLTNLNADAEVVYYEATGVAKKASGSPLITVEVTSGDAAAYDGT